MTDKCDGAELRMGARVMKPGMCIWKAFAVAMVLAGFAGEVAAQDYPSRAITVVVPFPPGGASDVVARIVTNQMSRILGQSIIIENVSGAGGTVGSARVAAGTRRLYVACRGNGLACRGARTDAEPQIRSRGGFRADRLHRPFPGGRDRAEGFSGAGSEGIRRGAAATGRRSEAGPWRYRRVLAYGVSFIHRGSRREAGAGRLPRFRPGLERSGRGRDDFMCEQSVSVAESVLAGSSRPSRSLLRNASRRCRTFRPRRRPASTTK